MQPFTTLTGIAAPLPIMNIDTDMIIPKQHLKTIKRTGLGSVLFEEMRFTPAGTELPDFALNKDLFRSAKILVAGENFGCGSSREHAPWALLDFGITCVIAPSFADIFYNNCFKNGILPIVLPASMVDELLQMLQDSGVQNDSKAATLTVDLPSQQIVLPDGANIPFEVDAFRKHCLINGLDDISLTLEKSSAINAFETHDRQTRPWIWGKAS